MGNRENTDKARLFVHAVSLLCVQAACLHEIPQRAPLSSDFHLELVHGRRLLDIGGREKIKSQWFFILFPPSYVAGLLWLLFSNEGHTFYHGCPRGSALTRFC